MKIPWEWLDVQEIHYERHAACVARHDVFVRLGVSVCDYTCNDGWLGKVYPRGRRFEGRPFREAIHPIRQGVQKKLLLGGGHSRSTGNPPARTAAPGRVLTGQRCPASRATP
jgi:hypothetical protein